MRDQITTGINLAIREAVEHAPTSALATLSTTHVTALTDAIIAALGQVPADTPAPVLTTLPAAAPVLTISPAEVVALVANGALTSGLDPHSDAAALCDYATLAHDDRRAFREFLFEVARMFGVRVRSVTEDGTRLFVLGGARQQVLALARVIDVFRDAAAPITADLTSDEQSQFWATVAALVTGTAEAQSLIEVNADAYEAATRYLVQTRGPARNLTRTAPATSGVLFDHASAVAVANTLTDEHITDLV